MASLELKVELDASLVVPLAELIRAQKDLNTALIDLCSKHGIAPTAEVDKLIVALSEAQERAHGAIHQLGERALKIQTAGDVQ